MKKKSRKKSLVRISKINSHRYAIHHKTIKSFDGTKIGYQIVGEGDKVIILCNGLGGTLVAWRPLYEYFGDRYKFISWDYRGLFESNTPRNISNMRIQDHVKDLDLILKKEKIKKALIAGWSMGVQVCLEYYRHNPKIFEAIFLLNGTSGRPFHTALNSPLSRYLLPSVNRIAHKIIPKVQPSLLTLANLLIDWKGFINLVSRLGLINKNLNAEVFQEVARAMVIADSSMYHEIMIHLSDHDTADMLSTVKVPTLIIGGEKDMLTPPHTAEKIARNIPESELLIIPQGTHYALLEFTDMINKRVGKFLKQYYPTSKKFKKAS